MNTPDYQTWQRGNEAHLSASLEWLRLKLEDLASSGPIPVLSDPAPRQPWFSRLLGRNPQAEVARPPPARRVTDEITRAEARVRETERLEPPPTLSVVSARLGLSTFERNVLLLCAAMELDTRTAALCARAQDNPARTYPTFALALALFDDPAWDALSPERGLRYWRLLEINQPAAQPLTTSALRADERIVNALKGLEYLDDRLAPLVTPLEPAQSDAPLPPSQQRAVEDAVGALRQGASGELPALELVGPDAESAQLVARHAATALGLPLYRLPLEHLGSQAAELETFTRLWQRESLLSPVALYVDALEQDAPSPGLRHLLNRSHGIVVVGTREIRAKSSRPTVTIDVGKPTPGEQRDLWNALLHAPNPEIPARLSSQFNLGTSEIGRIARVATAGSNPSDLLERAWDASRATTRARLEALAARIEARATWVQLVLPEPELSLLRRITDQVRARATVYQDWGFARTMNRGLGINALFAGESGTGKTMAAEVIANELRLDLYRIDLSSVVSKYIGETEKNLRRIFDAAEDGGMILFFDEADALFGKRSEVKDSHDRYANIEINYLLQRIENYRGLAILATNMKTALDPAFSRRLRFIIQFPFPGLEERMRLWEQVFPADTPRDALELDRLARFDLTGASIHNAALCAAFLAAHEGTRVTMNHVLEGIRTEYRKLERPVNDADFQWAGKLNTRTGAAA
jgi:hypothetical protein